MTPRQIIDKANLLGVTLSLSELNTIQYRGEEKSVEKVMPLLKSYKSELIQYFKFTRLFDFLRPLHNWGDLDYEVWCDDLTRSPTLTINCLRALKNSWNDKRYGYLIEEDWDDKY